MDIKTRDKRLAAIFDKDIMKQLDEAEKNVLGEEFSNSELRILASQDIKAIHSRLSNHLAAEYQRRLTQIQPEEYELLKDWYLENSHSLDEIICSHCGVLLGIEIDTIDDNMNPYHHEGKFIVPIGDKLMSYRPRLDGIMGYQCGNSITVSEEEKEKILSDLEVEKENRRNELKKEITDRRKQEFDQAVENIINDSQFPKLDTRNKVIKNMNFKSSTEEDIDNAVEIALEQEFGGVIIVEEIPCNNDTRWGQIEIDNIPEDHVMTSITKEDRIRVKQQMDATNYSPDVTETDSGKTVETFELRKVK